MKKVGLYREKKSLRNTVPLSSHFKGYYLENKSTYQARNRFDKSHRKQNRT